MVKVAEEDHKLDPLLTAINESTQELRRIRRYQLFTLLLALTTAAFFTRDFLLPIIIAIVMTLTLLPAVRFAERFAIPPAVAAVGLIIAMALMFIELGYILSGPAQTLAADAPRVAREVHEKLDGFIDRISEFEKSASEMAGGTTDADLKVSDGGGAATTPLVAVVEDGSGGVAGQIVTALASTGRAIAAALILTVFLLSSGDFYHRRVVEALPTLRDKKQALTIIRDIERQISRYLGAIFMINAALGVVVGVAMWMVGLQQPVVWGLLAFLLNFIPFVGNILNVILVAAMSLVTFDNLWDAALPPVILLILSLIESNGVTPLLIGRRLELNTVSQLIMVAFGTWLWGVAGAILAVPFLVMVKAVADNVKSLQVFSTFLAVEPSQRKDEAANKATSGSAVVPKVSRVEDDFRDIASADPRPHDVL